MAEEQTIPQEQTNHYDYIAIGCGSGGIASSRRAAHLLHLLRAKSLGVHIGEDDPTELLVRDDAVVVRVKDVKDLARLRG